MFDNTNKGALFKARVRKSENSPEYNGQINVGGVDYYLGAWVRTDKNGNKYFSLAVQKKESKPAPENEPANISQSDDIPF